MGQGYHGVYLVVGLELFGKKVGRRYYWRKFKAIVVPLADYAVGVEIQPYESYALASELLDAVRLEHAFERCGVELVV